MTAIHLPAIGSLTLHGARRGGALEPLAIDPQYERAAIPVELDRYEAYPNTFAAHEALTSICTLYAAVAGGPVEPDFRRAVKIQRLLAAAEAAAPCPAVHPEGVA